VTLRLLITGVLLFSAAHAAQQDQPPAQAQADQFFSGNVTKLEAEKVTVTRLVLGKVDATKTFTVTPETRIEGKLKLKARVTVRFAAADDGDRAVHILVRTTAAAPKK
jgi:Cu/Ag efflux protein CusF